MTAQSPKFLDQVRIALRKNHYAYKTEQAYVHWIKRFILFHHKRHPNQMGAPEVEAFLTDLAVNGQVTASTHKKIALRGTRLFTPSCFSTVTCWIAR